MCGYVWFLLAVVCQRLEFGLRFRANMMTNSKCNSNRYKSHKNHNSFHKAISYDDYIQIISTRNATQNKRFVVVI